MTDVERDVLIAAAAGEPRPQAVAPVASAVSLYKVRPISSLSRFSSNRMPTFLRAWTLGLGLPDPRRLLQGHGLEVLVLLQRAVQRGRALPQVEDPADLGVGVGDVAGQGVGVEPVEDLLAALVGILHQVRQGHHRVPRRLRDHLHGQALVLQGRRTCPTPAAW